MAISIDWGTKVINIPRADMVLVQSLPIEIRELPLNAFHLELKSLESSIEGMMFPDTHVHNTEVTLGGLTFARVIEIINGYTVTFEDGQYAVNLTGANSNVGDNVNVNQVSVRTQNSAGLISSPDIEYSSFNGGVSIDVSSGFSGTVYPTGTDRQKVDNIEDALLIAEYRGFTKLYAHSNLTINNQNISYIEIEGQSNVDTYINIEPSANVVGSTFKSSRITGELDGDNSFDSCTIEDISYVNGTIINSGLNGTIILGGSEQVYINNCTTYTMDEIPIINMSGGGQDLVMPNYTGLLKISNMSDASTKIGFGLDGGEVTLLNDVSSGYINISGIGQLIDENGASIISGIWNDNVIIINSLINETVIANAVLATDLTPFTQDFTVAASLQLAAYESVVWVDVIDGSAGTEYPHGTKDLPCNNMTCATTIAQNLGFNTIRIIGDYIFDSSILIPRLIFEGDGNTASNFTFPSKMIIPNVTIKNAGVTGWLSGLILIDSCHITDFGSDVFIPNSQEIQMVNTLIQGTITLPSTYSGTMQVLNCWAMPDASGSPPTLDHGNCTADIQIRNLSGFANIQNVSEEIDFRVFLNSGGVNIESTVTAGNFVLTGIGTLDNSAGGTATVNSDALINKNIISIGVWDEAMGDHVSAGTAGKVLSSLNFEGRIWHDASNGTAGTDYPIGTRAVPSNNPIDANFIGQVQGINEYRIIGNLDSGLAVSNLTLEGQNWIQDSLHVRNNHYEKISIKNLRVDGSLSADNTIFENCYLENLDNMNGEAVACRIAGNISVQPGGTFSAIELVVEGDNTVIDMQNQACTASLDVNSGVITFINSVAGCSIDINLSGGEIILDTSCTGGDFYIEGIGELTGDPVALGMNLVGNNLLSKEAITIAVWDESLAAHIDPGTTGKTLAITEFDGKVIIDTVNGAAGTAFPLGTGGFPVNNLADALTIKDLYGLFTLHIHGSLTIDGGEELVGINIQSHSSFSNSLHIVDASIDNLTISDLTVDGSMSGSVRYTTCVLGDIDGFDGGANDSLLTGTVKITGSGANYLTNCDTYETSFLGSKTIDMGDKNLNIIRGRGAYTLSNYTGSAALAFDFTSGSIIVDSGCVGGVLVISGLVTLIDNSSVGCTVIDGTISESGTANAVWDESLADHVADASSAGYITTNTANTTFKKIFPFFFAK